MGGLVSRMQTIESRDQFWKILSEEPFEKVQGEPETLASLRVRQHSLNPIARSDALLPSERR